MVQAYNFLASWQLFPEKCIYEKGIAPKSGFCKIEASEQRAALRISNNWVDVENQAFYSEFEVSPDGNVYPFSNEELADLAMATVDNASCLTIRLFKNDKDVIKIVKEILPNGHMRISQYGTDENGMQFVNKEVYHKQLSVLPYASSVGSVAIKPTEEGVIKHKALQAMEEQTNMQLDQIREQIELLARQAQELRKRKELSLRIYDARLSFQPVIGQTYYLYEKKDGSSMLSLISPQEWGGNGPFSAFLAAVRLLADHTWTEVAN